MATIYMEHGDVGNDIHQSTTTINPMIKTDHSTEIWDHNQHY